jgi:predicted CXXCH cytochrome family protein
VRSLMKAFWMTTLAMGVAAGGAVAQSNVSASKHNFSQMAWSNGEICLPCHTPHNAITGQPRLWNHELTNATYTLKGGSGTATADFDYRSRMCLSCHDGTVALDSFGGTNSSSPSTYIEGRGNLGTDLTNDHPVGSKALYPDPSKPWHATSFQPAASLPSAVALRDFTHPTHGNVKVVSCTTCHNPHKGADDKYLLRMTNSASALCLACHIK